MRDDKATTLVTSETLDADIQRFQKTWTRLGLDQSDANTPTDLTRRIDPDEDEDLWRRWTRSLPRLTIAENDEALEHTDLEIIGELGEGGMGVVYLARQHSLQREVAVKRSRGSSRDSGTIQRMLYEARHTGTLEHPNIVPVHALGLDEQQRPVLVMKRIKGALWRDMIHDRAHEGWSEVKEEALEWHLRVLMQVCNALHYAHSQGIVHRDLKPENIMIGDFGEVYVLDWGVALELELADEARVGLVGTPAYMAPEMVQGEEGRISAQTDVFLLGACLYEIIAGAPPYTGGNLFNVLMSAMKAAAPDFDPDTPEELSAICRRAKTPTPEARFESALALRQAIEVFLVHRDALRLTHAAEERLKALQALKKTADTDDIEVQRLFSACRFGFEQALEIWPENHKASQGHQKALGIMVEHALEQRDLKQAERLLDDIHEPDPSLGTRCESLRKALESEKQAQQDLDRLKKDQDLHLHMDKRMKMGLAQGPLLVVFSLGVTIAHTMGVFTIGHAEHLGLILAGALFLGLGIWVMREQVLSQSRNRTIITSIVVMLVGLVCSAAYAWIAQMKIADAFALDYIVLAIGLTFGSITGDRFVIIPALCFLAAAFATAFKPEWFVLIGGGAILLAHIALMPLVIWSKRREHLSEA